jgi:hypothetical protein
MARVRSTSCSHNNATTVEGKGHDSAGSAEITESTGASDAGSHSRAGGDSDLGSRTHSYYFEPSMITVIVAGR